MSVHGEDEPKDYHTLNDEHNKAIITELSENCGDADVSAVIKCYIIGSSNKDIRKQLKSHFVNPLKQAATYLGLNTEGEAKFLKEDLITYIIRRIETLLKDLCGVCGEYYNNTLQDEPPFTCLICTQGCHQPCYQEMKAVFDGVPDTMRSAFRFICTKCYGDFSDDHSAAKKPKQSPVKPKDEEVVIREETPDATVDNDTTNPTIPIVGEVRSEEGTTQIVICPAYKWGRCPDYENCEFRHPPRCWNWLNTGKCSYKKKCKYHHPPLCRNSLREYQCFNSECKYFHIAKTQRYKIEDEQLKNSLQPSNYHAQTPQSAQGYHHQPPHPISNQPRPPPQQQPNYHSHSANMHQQHHHQNVAPSQSSPSQPNMAFLLKAIKDIKDELGKEIAGLTQRLDMQVHNASQPQTTTTNTMAQIQPIPNQYSLPNILIPVQQQAGSRG